MVLKEISDADSPFDTSSLPTNDEPSYPSNYDYTPSDDFSTSDRRTITVNFPPTPNAYPPTCPGSSAFGFTPSRFGTIFGHELGRLTQLAQRPLTPDEVTAVLETTYKGFAFSSYGKPAGLLFAGYKLVQGQRKLTLPFGGMLAKSGTYYNTETGTMVLWGKDRAYMGLPNTQNLRIWLTIARFCWWVPVCWIGGQILGVTYGGTVASVGLLRDKRLLALNREAAEGIKKERMEKRGEGQEQRSRVPPAGEGRKRIDPTGQGERPLGDIWKERPQPPGGQKRQQRRRRTTDDDDASPTAGTYNEGDDDWSGFGVGLDSTETEKQTPIPSTMTGKPTSSRKASRKGSKSDDEPTGSFDPSTEGSSTEGESAWDRIRRQSGSDT